MEQCTETGQNTAEVNLEQNNQVGEPEQNIDPTKLVYNLVDLNGGGDLVKLLRDDEIREKIKRLRDEEIRKKINSLPDEEIIKKIEGYLDNKRKGEGESELVKFIRDVEIKEKIQGFLYGNGEGENKPIKEVIKQREKERRERQVDKQVNQWWKSSKVKSIDDDARKKSKEGCSKKFVCWDIKKRGNLGETILHICLLMKNSADHRKLAKMLVEFFPNLVHDIYLGDEYYGESPLHMAIVNEDTDMVEFLLKNGADVTERCFGAFFLPDDLKESCTVYPGSAV